MFKNTASQKLTVYVFDSTTNLPKTGDAANLTAYRDLDDGGVTVLTDTSATEKDATNAKGFYVFDLSQAETNGDKILFSCKSSTANMVCLAMPAVVYTTPPYFSTQSIDSNGRLDVIKLAGTTQTARDIGASVLLSSGTGTGQLSITSGIAKVDVDTIKTNPVVNGGTITFPTAATLASTTNITAGTITTVTTLTNDPSGVTTLLSRLGTPSDLGGGATVAANLSDIEAQTDDIGAAGAGLTAADDAILTRLGTPAGASVSVDIAAIKSDSAAVLVDTNELQTDWTNGGRLDLILDIIAADTTTDIPATLTTIASYISALKIKKNTQLAAFPFLMVLTSDHITPATGKTITATRSIDGAAFASCTNSAAEVSNGVYKITLSAADLNGDTIVLKFTESVCDQRTIVIATQP